MASVFRRCDRWYLNYKDGNGKRCQRSTTAVTKTEARRLASDLERKAERQFLGLEPSLDDESITFGECLRGWEEAQFRFTSGYLHSRGTFRKHLVDSSLANVRVRDLTTGKIQDFLTEKSEALAPQTVNHLRAFAFRALTWAMDHKKIALNPCVKVKRQVVPERVPQYLRKEEVPRVLVTLSRTWRALFATAIYSGLRKGELASLRKEDVDFQAGLIFVRRSWARDTTKNHKEESVPIAAELVRYLQEAIARSPSNLVFPKADGSMMPKHTPLEDVLRSALARAGIVIGYRHVCRRKGCGHAEQARGANLRHCPKCGMKLWPKPCVRPLRFHDLRHTTASLLIMNGASLVAVQRILRHSDPRTTAKIYVHLLPDYSRDQINLLSFDNPANEVTSRPSSASPAAPCAATVVQDSSEAPSGSPEGSENPLPNQQVTSVSAAGFEPATPGFGGRYSIQMSYAPFLF